MNLEVIVKNKKDFEELLPYSTYASELTGVMEFDSSIMRKGIPLMDKYFTEDEMSEIKGSEAKYILDIDEKRKISIIAPDTYMAFCNASKPKGSSIGFISVVNLREVYILMKYGLVSATKDFKAWYSPLSKNCKLSELHSFTNKKKFRNNNAWTFKSYFENEFKNKRIRIAPEDLTVNSVNIFSFGENVSIPIQNELRGNILDINRKSKKALLDVPGGTVEVEMYGWAPFRYSCWQEGGEIRLLYKKMYGDSKYRKIINPIVLPEDINIDNKEKFFKDMMFLSNRRYPSELHNRMYFEYKIRTLGEE